MRNPDVFTPPSIIAGSVPLKGHVDPVMAAFHAAAAALDDERLQLIHQRHQDRVYYLAAPAMDFASVNHAVTPLASALPGSSGHQGPGHYCCDIENGLFAVVSITASGTVQAFTGIRNDAMRFADDGQPLFWPEQTKPWQGVNRLAQQASQKTLRWIAAAAFAGTLLLTAGSVAALTLSAKKEQVAESARSQYKAAADKARQEFNAFEAKNRIWQQFLAFELAVVERQGQALRYADDGVKLSYQLSLPVWAKDFKPFAGASSKEYDKQTVILTKGDTL